MGRRQKMSEQSATLLLVQLALLVSLVPPAPAREGPTPVLSTEQIVEKLIAANARRAQALQAYRGKRSYTLEYHGFPGGRSADMSVEAAYTAPDKKEFNIVSRNGSKLLLTRVLQKLVDSEKEAMQEENRRATELSPRNYEFNFLQMDRTPQGNAYVLEVKPRVNYKFLYRERSGSTPRILRWSTLRGNRPRTPHSGSAGPASSSATASSETSGFPFTTSRSPRSASEEKRC